MMIRRFKSTLYSFVNNSRGNTLIEFALGMPLLILLVSGIFEVSMFALLNSKLIRIAGNIGNIVSIQNINKTTLDAIIATAPQMASPLQFTGKGNVIVSLIYNNGQTTNPANMLISWQGKSLSSATSKLGTAGFKPTNMPNNYQVLNTQTVLVTEVFYSYTPYVFTGFIPNQTLYKTVTYVPRQGDMVTLLTP